MSYELNLEKAIIGNGDSEEEDIETNKGKESSVGIRERKEINPITSCFPR